MLDFASVYYGVVINVVSPMLWWSNGKGCKSCHSRAVPKCDAVTILRWDLSASHKIKIKNSNAINEIIDPADDTIFHFK